MSCFGLRHCPECYSSAPTVNFKISFVTPAARDDLRSFSLGFQGLFNVNQREIGTMTKRDSLKVYEGVGKCLDAGFVRCLAMNRGCQCEFFDVKLPGSTGSKCYCGYTGGVHSSTLKMHYGSLQEVPLRYSRAQCINLAEQRWHT